MLNFINYNAVIWIITNQIWSRKSLLSFFLIPFSFFYGAISELRRLSFQLGLCKSWRAPCPVIVVGNLTVGGNGKTPVVIWLVQALREKGLNAGVVSRGYGRKIHSTLLVTSKTSPIQAGDEPVLIAQRTKAAVAVAKQRKLGIELLLNTYNHIDMIIADDGLQNYAMQRDYEIVVVDGIRRFGNGWWLPAGPMRERIGRLRKVDAVIINGGDTQNTEIAMTLQPCLAVNFVTGKTATLDKLPPIVAVAGIGHPLRFFNTVKEQGVNLVSEIVFADHHMYNEIELCALIQDDQCLLTTEKDAVKCHSFAHSNWWYLPVNAHLFGTKVSTLLDDIKKLCIK